MPPRKRCIPHGSTLWVLHLQELSDRKRFLTYLKYEYWRKKKKKKKKKRIADAGTRTLALPTRRPVVLPLRYFGTCWHKLKQNINKLCSDTWPNVYSPPRFMNCWYIFYFVFVFDVRLCLHVVFSKTSMVWILRWIYLRSEPYCLLSVVLSFAFLSVVFKKIFFGLIIS